MKIVYTVRLDINVRVFQMIERKKDLIFMPPSKKEEHIASHMSVGPWDGLSVSHNLCNL